MANVDFFGNAGDYPTDPGTGFTPMPTPDTDPGTTLTPVPGGNNPIGTGPITTQPLPRGPVIDPEAPGATPPGSPTSFGHPVYDQIGTIYRNVSNGAYTPTMQDVSQWGTNVDPQYMATIRSAIMRWWQGQGRTGATTPTSTTPGTPTQSAADFIKAYQGQHAQPDLNGLLQAMKAAGYNVANWVDPQYGTSHNEISLDGQKYKVIGAEDSPGAYWYTAGMNDSGGRGTGGVSPNGMGYDDPSAQIYLQQLASRLNQLNNPQPDPWENILKLFALARVGNLSGDPYTGAEDAALVAHYRDPLTEARDASLQRNKERIGARGMASTSGLLDVLNRGTEQSYERGIASGSNDLAVRAVQEKQRRADEQLAILGNILGVNRTGVDRKNELADRAVSIAQMFPNFDAQRLDMLLRASGEGAANPNSTMANLTSLGNLGLTSSIYQNNQDQANAAFWGQLIASLIPARNTA